MTVSAVLSDLGADPHEELEDRLRHRPQAQRYPIADLPAYTDHYWADYA